MKRASAILSFILMLAFSATAQLTVYTTYEDYTSDKGQKYDKSYDVYSVSGSDAFGGSTITFKSTNGQKVKVASGKVWGFMYKTTLFRTEQIKKTPVAVISHKNICYYENGSAYLFYLKNGNTMQTYALGAESYMSKNLNSEIFRVDWGYAFQDKLKKIKQENPDAAPQVDCVLKSNKDLSKMRECFSKQ